MLRRKYLTVTGAVAMLLTTAAYDAHAQTVVSVPSNLLGGGSWTNYIRLADLDADGDLDITIANCGGFFASPVAEAFVMLSNGGAGDFAITQGPHNGSKKVRVVAVGDIDGDGDNDVFLPNAGGGADEFYVFDGNAFVNKAADLLPNGGTKSASAAARFGDVDNDGDLDLLVAQRYLGNSGPPVRLLLNDGSGVFTASTAVPSFLPGSNPDDIDFVDIDRDFDLDVLINTHSGGAALWRNDGSGAFTDVSTNFPAPVSGPYAYGPSACDVDGDGDLDIWRDNVGGGAKREQLLINDGDGNFSDESSTRIIGNPDNDDNGVWCVDIDLDGDFDAVVAALGGPQRLLVNDGHGTFTYQPGRFPNEGDCTLWLDWGDVNDDGRLDLVAAQGECGSTNRLYLGNGNMPIDTRAPEITHAEMVPASVMVDDEVAFRFAVTDQLVSDSGPRLKRAFLKVTLDNGATTEVNATFMGGDLFRATLPSNGGEQATVTPCASDHQDNEGCGQPQSYSIEGGTASSGSGGTGGTTATAGSGGSTSSGNSGGSGGSFAVEDEGCGCRVLANKDSDKGLAGVLLALGLGAVARLRRRRD